MHDRVGPLPKSKPMTITLTSQLDHLLYQNKFQRVTHWRPWLPTSWNEAIYTEICLALHTWPLCTEPPLFSHVDRYDCYANQLLLICPLCAIPMFLPDLYKPKLHTVPEYAEQ